MTKLRSTFRSQALGIWIAAEYGRNHSNSMRNRRTAVGRSRSTHTYTGPSTKLRYGDHPSNTGLFLSSNLRSLEKLSRWAWNNSWRISYPKDKRSTLISSTASILLFGHLSRSQHSLAHVNRQRFAGGPQHKPWRALANRHQVLNSLLRIRFGRFTQQPAQSFLHHVVVAPQ